ncbi:MAG: 50S ribosomal protein L15 [Candidatus Uhrbacteria bacterium]|nr:50S ribosomal protein L15 [Candidatus Uhrbacteria bacterium]
MPLTLNNLKPSEGSKKSKKRLGRGFTGGKTSGRGHKGQKSRSGVGGLKRLGLRSLMLATPKVRGFQSQAGKPAVVNLGGIDSAFKKDDVVSPQTLLDKKLIASKKDGVKILGDGEIRIAVKVKGCKVSKSAVEKITAAGGNVSAK